MIKILVVDDNSEKIDEIGKIINEFGDIGEDQVNTANNLNDARKYLSNEKYDLLILDMNIPIKIGGDAKNNAGVDLLRDIDKLERINKPSNIVGLTAHEDLKELYECEFNISGWILIQYSRISSMWKDQLRNKIQYIIDDKESQMNSKNSLKEYDYDLAIITALRETELESVLNIKEACWKEFKVKNDPTIYYKGIFKNEKKSIRVVAAASSQMGMPSAAVLSIKIINNFTPKCLVMVGIAAGVKGVGNFGDILIAEQCWDYGSGKIVYNKDLNTREFKPDPKPITIELSIKEDLSSTLKKYTSRIYEEWTGNKPETVLKAIMGPVASGSAVVQDEKIIQEQGKSVSRKLIGIEMEIYGVYCAAIQCSEPRPKYFALKSICDFADGDKSDDYHKYAAFTSARYLYHFSLDKL